MQHRTDSIDQKERMFERSGFRTQFYGTWFDFHLPTAITRSSEISEGMNAEINRIDEVDQRALVVYDTSVFGFELSQNGLAWQVVTHEWPWTVSLMVGYTVVKLTYKHGYKLGPLFADSIANAEKLLKSLFEELIQSPPPVDCFDVITKNGLWSWWKTASKEGLLAFLYRCKYMLWKAVWYYWYLSWVTCKGTDYSRTFIQRSSCLVIWIQFYICIY